MDDFIRIPKAIYKDCPQYVPDLESSVRELFDVRCNPGLEFSDIQPFVAYRDGMPVGRIVGIVNRRANERWGTQNVRFSMIEFIDDREVSAALLDAVEQWGRGLGMTAIHGPLGITDFDKEGMLVEDFDLLGSMNMSYNLDYYPRHLEALGYEKEVDWVQIHIDIPQEVPAKYARVAQYVREQLGLRVIKLTNRDIFERGYGKKAFDLLNIAFKPIFGYSTLSDKQIKLATYASRCIENEILMYLRKLSGTRSVVSLDEPLNTDWDGNELLLSDVLGTDADEISRTLEDDVERQMLLEAVDRLEEREKRIISLRFGLRGRRELTQKQVADLLGISQSYISRLEKRIILRLRREIGKMT